jgi:hypothetical protein
MSNTVKAIIVASAIIILVSGIFILSKSRGLDNVPNQVVFNSSQVSISSIISSSKTALSSSSSIDVSKVAEVLKNSQSTITSKITEPNQNLVSIFGTIYSPNKSIELPCKDYYPSLTGGNPAPFAPKYKEYIQQCSEIGINVKIFKLVDGKPTFEDVTNIYEVKPKISISDTLQMPGKTFDIECKDSYQTGNISLFIPKEAEYVSKCNDKGVYIKFFKIDEARSQLNNKNEYTEVTNTIAYAKNQIIK